MFSILVLSYLNKNDIDGLSLTKLNSKNSYARD